MKVCLLPVVLFVVLMAGCDSRTSKGKSEEGGGPENIDAAEKATAARLTPVKDPITEQIWQAKLKTRQAYNNRRFDELEQEAAGLRAKKEVFANGSWKIVQFYEALDCADNEPESMWQLHDQIHQEWIAAQPGSITARVAYAEFLTGYAWQARGTG